MPFHAVYNSRRATPSRDTAADVWGELASRYVRPELNAKSSPEEVWKGIVMLDKMGYVVVDSATNTQGPVITQHDLPSVMAIVAKPKPPKPPKKPRPAPPPAAKKK